MFVQDPGVQKLVTIFEENAKLLKEKLEYAKSIQDQIKSLESSPEYLSVDQIKALRAETEEKIKTSQEIKTNLEKLRMDPNFLRPDKVKRLGQVVQRLRDQL